MLLYHGTSERAARLALRQGLRTRSSLKLRGNWHHTVQSNPKAVYLTDSYAGFFAMSAIKGEGNPAVIEVDIAQLNPFDLYPDEDMLEQVGRGHDDVPGDIVERTKHYRRIMTSYVDKWEVSLKHMGTVAHIGDIPPQAITRIAIIDEQKLRPFCFAHTNPSISVINYSICGAEYRWLSAVIFEPDLPITQDVYLHEMRKPFYEELQKLLLDNPEAIKIIER